MNVMMQVIHITYFHADLPFLSSGTQFLSRQTEPLEIVGSHGLKVWFE